MTRTSPATLGGRFNDQAPRPEQVVVLVGWFAVIVWTGALILVRTGVSFGIDVAPAGRWIGAVIGATRCGLSYHLAYQDGGPAVRRRPFVPLDGPLALAGVGAVPVLVRGSSYALAGFPVGPGGDDLGRARHRVARRGADHGLCSAPRGRTANDRPVRSGK